MTITVVGGGLAGLVAAIECAERGQRVEVHEATSLLGGRARSQRTEAGFVANHGGHVLYADGPLWRWLVEKGLARPARKPPVHGFRIRFDGVSRRVPPVALVAALRLLRRDAPIDRSLREWATDELGSEAAEYVCRACHVFSFDADPGRLSAAFCTERLRRAVTLPPVTRYVVGGWGALVERLAARATSLGVRIATGSRIDAVGDLHGAVIVATELAAARRLLGDDSLTWTGTRTAILDVGLASRRGDPFVVVDLDGGVFVERYSAPDRTLAPPGHDLVQTQVGLWPDESLEDGVRRIESCLDDTCDGWREREVWRRRYVVTDASGALDLPGTTWRDRPAIDRGDGVHLCGDMVAAPGLLGEVSWASAVDAARLACGEPALLSTS